MKDVGKFTLSLQARLRDHSGCHIFPWFPTTALSEPLVVESTLCNRLLLHALLPHSRQYHLPHTHSAMARSNFFRDRLGMNENREILPNNPKEGGQLQSGVASLQVPLLDVIRDYATS